MEFIFVPGYVQIDVPFDPLFGWVLAFFFLSWVITGVLRAIKLIPVA